MGMVQLLFGFNGRINRKQYWLTGLASGGVVWVLAAALSAVAPNASWAIALAIMLIMGWIGLALNVKRFHDRGRTGYLALAPLVPLVMIVTTLVSSAGSNEAFFAALQQTALWLGVSALINIWFFIDLGLLPGEDGPNKFDAPRGPTSAPGAPTGPRPGKAATAASSMFGAEQAMERALAEQQMRAKAPPAPRTAAAPKPATAAASAPSFGRRVVQ